MESLDGMEIHAVSWLWVLFLKVLAEKINLLGSASLIQYGKYIWFSPNPQVLKNAINMCTGAAGTRILKVLPELRV